MATRLYPRTKDVRTLELLAGAPLGTMARLEALRKEIGVGEGADYFENERRYERFWNAVQDDEALAALDHLLTFGWGRVQSDEVETYAGCERCPIKVARILGAQGVPTRLWPMILTDGVCWS